MASYATQADLERLLSPSMLVTLTDDDGNRTADTGVITGILADATAQVDAALEAGGYTVPVTSPDTFLAGLTARLCVRSLYSRRASVAQVIPDLLRDLADRADQELRDIAAGKLVVGCAVAASSGGGIAQSDYASTRWTDDVELF
jgi:phage gp36-like protein